MWMQKRVKIIMLLYTIFYFSTQYNCVDIQLDKILLVYILCSQLVDNMWNIFNLLIKTYLSLILIKYLINESKVKIKSLE
jgi:hypothetical protein